jgi:hypothetical protein
MHSQIDSLFDEAERRYLKPEELTVISQYVGSLPARLMVYRAVRDRELEMMQWVADQLQTEFAKEPVEHLERSIKNGLLALRYCAMAMLLNDASFVNDRLSWLSGTVSIHNTRPIDEALYRLLNRKLSETLGNQAMILLDPFLSTAQGIVLQPVPALIS